MRHHEIVPHTADVRVMASGDSLPELFLAALEGMAEVMCEGACRSPGERPLSRRVELSSYDTTALLIDFLSEALTLAQIDDALYCEARFADLSPTSLTAELRGMSVDRFDLDVKAVSYHEAEVVQDGQGGYHTSVIFDI